MTLNISQKPPSFAVCTNTSAYLLIPVMKKQFPPGVSEMMSYQQVLLSRSDLTVMC